MTEVELSAILQEHGWYLVMAKKYKTRYAYAKRRVGNKVQTKYLMTEGKFPQLTREEILNKIL